MKRWLCVAAMLAIGLAGGVANAAQGDWLGLTRVISISPDASFSALNLDVDTQTTLALELILATQKQEVTAGGVPVGTVKHLPPTLTLQYHFAPDASFRPYAGAGLKF